MACYHIGRTILGALLDAIKDENAPEITRLEGLIISDQGMRNDFIDEFSAADSESAKAVYFKTGILEQIAA
jgi:hypothetical protein